MLVAAIIFGLSLFGIGTLFAVKAWEVHSERILAPGMRGKADENALKFKRLLNRSRDEMEKLPPRVVYLSRVALHLLALGTARFARFLEAQAHRVADLVSHKRTFEKRETNSEFLKQVSDFKDDSRQ